MESLFELFTTYNIDTDFLGVVFCLGFTLVFLMIIKTFDILGGK